MNIFKKLFGGQKTTEEVKQEKEKDFDMVNMMVFVLSACINLTLQPSLWNTLCS